MEKKKQYLTNVQFLSKQSKAVLAQQFMPGNGGCYSAWFVLR